MKRSPKILPECYGDTTLAELLGFINPNHQTSGIGQVLKVLEKQMTNQTVIGIIDSDKKITPLYYQQFQTIRSENHLLLKKHPQSNHYLVMAEPALEKFILMAAEECGIPATEIPFSEHRLKEVSKTQQAGKNQEFKNLLNRIIQKKSPGTETMKSRIIEILGDEY